MKAISAKLQPISFDSSEYFEMQNQNCSYCNSPIWEHDLVKICQCHNFCHNVCIAQRLDKVVSGSLRDIECVQCKQRVDCRRKLVMRKDCRLKPIILILSICLIIMLGFVGFETLLATLVWLASPCFCWSLVKLIFLIML